MLCEACKKGEATLVTSLIKRLRKKINYLEKQPNWDAYGESDEEDDTVVVETKTNSQVDSQVRRDSSEGLDERNERRNERLRNERLAVLSFKNGDSSLYKKGDSPLHVATMHGYLAIANMLILELQVDVEARNDVSLGRL